MNEVPYTLMKYVPPPGCMESDQNSLFFLRNNIKQYFFRSKFSKSQCCLELE